MEDIDKKHAKEDDSELVTSPLDDPDEQAHFK